MLPKCFPSPYAWMWEEGITFGLGAATNHLSREIWCLWRLLTNLLKKKRRTQRRPMRVQAFLSFRWFRDRGCCFYAAWQWPMRILNLNQTSENNCKVALGWTEMAHLVWPHFSPFVENWLEAVAACLLLTGIFSSKLCASRKCKAAFMSQCFQLNTSLHGYNVCMQVHVCMFVCV